MKNKIALIIPALLLVFTAACGPTAPTVTTTEPPASTSSPDILPSVEPTLDTVDLGTRADPGSPGQVVSQIIDASTLETGPLGYATSGDNPVAGFYERPFNPMMGYLNPIDILYASLAEGETYLFIDIQTAGRNPYSDAMDARYAVELDTDYDGRGDILFWIVPPYTEQWSTVPIMIFQDANDDVGGVIPLIADEMSGDGYDTLLYDGLSVGIEPVALARMNPDDPSLMQLAFQPAFVNAVSFLWGVWADGGTACPSCMEYNDRNYNGYFGSPIRENPYFPIGIPYALDNTCRLPYGFTPTGNEPGLCAVVVVSGNLSRGSSSSEDQGGAKLPESGDQTAGGGEPPASATITGYTFVDSNANGNWDSGETITTAYPVALYSIDCSTEYASVSTDSTGKFIFDGLMGGGDYCVKPNTAGLLWTPSNATFSLGSGDWAWVNFGLQSDNDNQPQDDDQTGGNEGGGIPPAQSSISGRVVLDNNSNGVETLDPPAAGHPVALMDGTCTTTLASTSADSNGEYSFSGLPPGNFCVSINEPTAPATTVSLGEGENRTVSFGIMPASPPATTPLSLSCPSDIIVTADSSGYAIVNFTLITMGGCPPITASCNSTSGNRYAVGSYSISCNSIDPCGQTASCSFNITVNPP